MKTLKFYHVLSGFLALSLATGCSSDEENNDLGGISSQEAADLIAEALSEDSGGAKLVINEFALISNNELPGEEVAKSLPSADRAVCGVPESYSDNQSYTSGDRTVVGTFAYDYEFTCNGFLPILLTGDASASLTYTGPNFVSEATYTVGGTISNLTGTVEPYLLNGTVNYNSSSTVNDNLRTFELDWVMDDFEIDRVSYDLVGGSGTITLAGSGPNGSYEVTAEYTVTNDNEIVVTINGNVFTIDLGSGIVIES